MEAVIKSFVVLITNLNLELLGLQIFNLQGRSHELISANLELALIQHIVF
jgi:hypothetical protein